jgi:outer membrane protein OmpA-like peptidoglycan-associated protein
MIIKRLLILASLLFAGCASYSRGPDKQYSGMLTGAATGAGAGAVTGFQVAASSGPGAAIGAGFGAVAGAVHGVIKDKQEEYQREVNKKIEEEVKISEAQKILAHYANKRVSLHPDREIFPADVLFFGDETTLRPGGIYLIKELAKLNKERYPWSRIVVASYVKSIEETSFFAKDLARERARAISEVLANSGINPRRIEPRAIVVKDEVLIDTNPESQRYAQAIEFIMADAKQ